MQITFFSFFMSIVCSSIFIIAIYLCRKTRFLSNKFGVTSLIVLYLFCIIRMVLPFDFLFTRGLISKGAFSSIYEYLAIDKINLHDFCNYRFTRELFTNRDIKDSYERITHIVVNIIGDYEVSLLSVVLFIWIIISTILIIRFAVQYYIAMRKVLSYSIREDEQCKRVFECIKNNCKKQMKITVRYSSDVNVPIGIGVFGKSIVLPDEVYSDKELYYILKHEYTHFLNRDLSVKMFMHIFCCVFWWNPIVYLLKKDLNQSLEIKCDLCVTNKMDIGSKADYLKTIVSILKRTDAKKKRMVLCCAAGLFSKNSASEIVERFKIVSENKNNKLKNKSKVLTTVLLFVFVVVFVFSYSFVVLPYYDVDVCAYDEEYCISELSSSDSYIVENKSGVYTMVSSKGNRWNIGKDHALAMKERGFKIVKK